MIAEMIWSLQLFCSGIMCGLAWFVQLNHYPLMLAIPVDHFAEYEREHVRRTGWIAAPAMLAELTAGLGLAYLLPHVWYTWGNTSLLLLLWASTFLIQVPIHRQLQRNGKNEILIRRLVTTNWIRSVAWTAVFIGLILHRL